MTKDNIKSYLQYTIRILFIFSIICLSIFIISKFNPAIGEDEPFTMGLIHHSFSRLIYIDSLDVHPPLYYIVLKAFLIITTFWTDNILVKIMFAKILSVLFLLITLIELSELLKLVKINVNYKLLILTYLSILSVINFSLQIRMYEMALAFISIEFVNLVKFFNNNKFIYLIISIIAASISSYTHYFAAIFAGSIILLFMIKEWKRHSFYNVVKLLLSGLIFLILFMPCVTFAYKQVVHTSSPEYYNDANPLPIAIIESMSGINFHGLFSILFGIIIVLSTICLTIFIFIGTTSKLKPILFDLIIAFTISITIPIIFSIFSHQIMDGRYFYPLVSIYEFLLISFVLNYINIHDNNNLWMLIFIIIIMFSLPLGILGKTYGQVHVNDLTSIGSYKYVHRVNYSKNKHINIDAHNNQTNNITYDSIYMENLYHMPKLSVTHLRISQYVGSNDKTLMNDVFSNIHVNN